MKTAYSIVLLTTISLCNAIDPPQSVNADQFCNAVLSSPVGSVLQEITETPLINTPNSRGRYPITYAVRRKDKTEGLCIAQALIDRGCELRFDTDTKKNNNKIVHKAIWTESSEMLELLLHSGADPNETYWYPYTKNKKTPGTPPQRAVSDNTSSFVKILCKHGANVHVLSKGKQGLLFDAVLDDEIESSRADLVYTLGKHGIDTEHQDYNGKRAIDHPTDNDTLTALLEIGSSITNKDKTDDVLGDPINSSIPDAFSSETIKKLTRKGNQSTKQKVLPLIALQAATRTYMPNIRCKTDMYYFLWACKHSKILQCLPNDLKKIIATYLKLSPYTKPEFIDDMRNRTVIKKMSSGNDAKKLEKTMLAAAHDFVNIVHLPYGSWDYNYSKDPFEFLSKSERYALITNFINEHKKAQEKQAQ